MGYLSSIGTNEYVEARLRGSWMQDPAVFGYPSAIAVPRHVNEIAALIAFSKATGVRMCVACGRHTHLSVRQVTS